MICWQPVDCVATMAAAGMCFGVFLRAKKAENKSSTFSAFISAFIGITEPALYGVAFRFKKPLLACIIGGGISGAFVAMMQAKAITYAMPAIISLPGIYRINPGNADRTGYFICSICRLCLCVRS